MNSCVVCFESECKCKPARTKVGDGDNFNLISVINFPVIIGWDPAWQRGDETVEVEVKL